jgi:hypothetical protein
LAAVIVAELNRILAAGDALAEPEKLFPLVFRPRARPDNAVRADPKYAGVRVICRLLANANPATVGARYIAGLW